MQAERVLKRKRRSEFIFSGFLVSEIIGIELKD
jgi:hypothetical protein